MIDIGVNLTNGQFKDDLEQVLEESFASGLKAMILTGTDLESSFECLRLCETHSEKYPNQLFCTAGVHPHDASSWTAETKSELRQLLVNPAVVASGETGLDFNRNYSSKVEQISAFEGQIELAADSRKPLFLHERDAFETQFDMLRNCRDDITQAVVHCFTGSKEALFAYLDLDFYIGITGWVCDERRGTELAGMVANIPLDRLMVETDAPFLLPRNIDPKPVSLGGSSKGKSRRNEPRYLSWVIKKIAECYGMSEEEIAQATTSNAQEFFQLPNLNA
jgi:TatD DNase family protein